MKVTDPEGAAPELPPEESVLRLSVPTNAVIVKDVFAGTVVTLGVAVVVVGAATTVNVTGVLALLAP
jgi:hypothetical protein